MEFAPAGDGVRRRAAGEGRAARTGPRSASATRSGRRRAARSACATRTRSASASRWSCSLAASDAETRGRGLAARGAPVRDRPRVPRARATPTGTSRASSTEEGDEINRARFERDGVDLALRSSLERWGLVEAGVRFGRVKTRARGGLDLPEANDQVGALFGSVVVDTLDDLAWPEHGRRLARLRRVEPRRPRRRPRVLAGAGRGPGRPRSSGKRLVAAARRPRRALGRRPARLRLVPAGRRRRSSRATTTRS